MSRQALQSERVSVKPSVDPFDGAFAALMDRLARDVALFGGPREGTLARYHAACALEPSELISWAASLLNERAPTPAEQALIGETLAELRALVRFHSTIRAATAPALPDSSPAIDAAIADAIRLQTVVGTLLGWAAGANPLLDYVIWTNGKVASSALHVISPQLID